MVIVRRDDRHLQLGLEPPHRLVMRDEPEIRALLEALQRGRPLPRASIGTTRALAQLADADLLDREPAADADVTVRIAGPRSLAASASSTLRAAGIAMRDRADVTLLLAYGAVARHLTDPLVRDGLPHLVAVVGPWGWDVGPFVVPGETACLRCVDAVHAETDPRHPLVLDQLARAATPVVSDPAVQALALGWVARDLRAYAQGYRPTTWSTTVRIAQTPDEEPLGERRWLRHPCCGCAWDALTG